MYHRQRSMSNIEFDLKRFAAYKNIKHQCIIKGDEKYCSIAAASIIAKTYRDQLMIKLDKDYPHYNWKKNIYKTSVN